MKAISLLQPWAGLWASGIKKVETRSWSSKYIGRLYIHASGKYDRSAQGQHMRFVEMGYGNFDPQFLETGCIIGYINVVRCMKASDYRAGCDFNAFGWTNKDWKRESVLGDLSLDTKRYAWIGENPLLFKTPISCKGKLSIWDIPADVQQLISEAIERGDIIKYQNR